MTQKELLDQALALPPGERARLAREIIASLDEPRDTGVASAWVAEIQRRFEEVRDGSVELLDWADVRKRIESKLARH